MDVAVAVAVSGRGAVAVAVAVAVSGGGAVAVAVAGLTKRFFNHIQKDFLINDLNQDVRISIFNVIRTKMLGYNGESDVKIIHFRFFGF